MLSTYMFIRLIYCCQSIAYWKIFTWFEVERKDHTMKKNMDFHLTYARHYIRLVGLFFFMIEVEMRARSRVCVCVLSLYFLFLISPIISVLRQLEMFLL